MMQFTYLLFISTWFCLFQNIKSGDLSIPIPYSVTQHTWHPSLFYALPVKTEDLQPYIDPQFKVYDNNGVAYLLYSLSNASVPGLVGFADAAVYVVVKYKNQFHKFGLHTQFNTPGPAQSGSLYDLMPYGYGYTQNMYSIINEATYTYQFVINDNQIQLNTSITWNPNQVINVDTVQPNDL
jgi:hypothetical protein